VSNLQLYFAIGLPCFTILASLIVNILTVSGIREDIREIRSDLKNIVGALNELDKRVSLIEDRILGGSR
jgi:hypothetical protein